MISTADGLHLYAEKIGSGPDAILIPQRIYMREYFERLAARRTAIFYDPRNRGLSETITDPDKISRGILHDVDDLESIREHYGFEQMAILSHSYISTAAILYAAAHPQRVTRLVLLGPMPPDPSKQYPVHLQCSDGALEAFQQRVADLRNQASAFKPDELCRKFWALLRALYVADPDKAGDLHWEPCDLPNEVNFMRPFLQYIVPSLAAARPSAGTLSRITAPVLIIHGRKDRSAPYGGGRDWAANLPNARILTIDNAAHVPWIEQPAIVYGAIETFLDGDWPTAAEKVR